MESVQKQYIQNSLDLERENRMKVIEIIDKLNEKHQLKKEEWIFLFENRTKEEENYIFSLAMQQKEKYYGNEVYTRGLIEFTNYCKNDCNYCGIRRSNQEVMRYHLSKDEIFACCDTGYELGFRTFVLQGGEDMSFTDDDYVEIIRGIKAKYPDCAITLSLGERSKESFQTLYEAGADRYLLRHETANEAHYNLLHPKEMSFQNRIDCLYTLKEIGYQVGCGFMVGSPGQTFETLAEDFLFIQKLKPHMVGIGPFIAHHQTPFSKETNGTLEMTLLCLGLLRLLQPNLLLPATTALGTISPTGREKGILSGANVVMPNLSPVTVRKKYELYDNKICTGDEAAECRMCLGRRMKSISHELVVAKGDCKDPFDFYDKAKEVKNQTTLMEDIL